MYLEELKRNFPSWEEASKFLSTFDEKELGASYKRVRIALGLSLDDVILLGGKDMGISRSSLSAIENGKQSIRAKHDHFLRKLYVLT